jgi:hypothetical protein
MFCERPNSAGVFLYASYRVADPGHGPNLYHVLESRGFIYFSTL